MTAAAGRDLELPDGRVLRAYDAGAPAECALTVLWHHGTPQSGAPLEPVATAAAARGIRLLSSARPGYGGSSPAPGRDVAGAAADAAAVADAFGSERFAVMGASGGGAHALACAARLPERVTGVACLGAIAPFTDAFDWWAGMVSQGALRAARSGREARVRHAETAEFDEASFTAADWAALEGPWRALGADAGRAGEAWPDGQIDDDLALAAPWGFDPADVAAPVLLVHGGEDRVVPVSHAHWLLGRCPRAELWLRPRDGHVSVLAAVPVALDWLLDAAGARR